jgi:nicotinate phosphoribosyltransferase
MAVETRTRLDPETFELPVEEIRAGVYTDAYFNNTRAALREAGRHPTVLMQIFQKRHARLGGADEALAILKLCADDWSALTVRSLHDGDAVEPWETVMTIEGDYTTFAHLETLYLGVLARGTLVTTNVASALEAANGKPIIYMPARHDDYHVQARDGYAAYVAGRVVGAPITVTTDVQASWWGGTGVGTLPHSLIAALGGDTIRAAEAFAAWASDDTNVTVLVDFDNNCVSTSLAVAEALGDRLWGVRLDTSETLVDRSLWSELGDFKPTGVNSRLVHKVREALDGAGRTDVRILVSGGFTADKIREFEDGGVPVDVYGIGSSLIRGSNDFTADVVLADGRPAAKVGRKLRPNSRLERVD